MSDRGVKRGRSWTSEEDELLREWQSKVGNRWSQVAKHIPGRSGQQCAQRWRHKGNPEICKRRWTDEEDQKLKELVIQCGNAWAHIARQLPGRTDQQCMGRWRRHLDPNIKYSAWEEWEDRILSDLVEKHGSKWSAMAPHFGNRTPQQIRARWMKLSSEVQLPPHIQLPPPATHKLATLSPQNRCRKRQAVSQHSPGAENMQPEEPIVQTANTALSFRSMGVGSQSLLRPLPARKALTGQDGGSPRLPGEVFVPRRRRDFHLPLTATRELDNCRATSNGPIIHSVHQQPPLAASQPAGEQVRAQSSRFHAAHFQSLTSAVHDVLELSQHAGYFSDKRPRNSQASYQASTATKEWSETALHTNVLFFWLQVLLLQPLRPVLTGQAADDRAMAARMKTLAWMSAATFALFCCPKLR